MNLLKRQITINKVDFKLYFMQVAPEMYRKIVSLFQANPLKCYSANQLQEIFSNEDLNGIIAELIELKVMYRCSYH